ncbi:hypothetical protein PLICRDRAFT_404877 [Plicaturopsis crispa FD-325 SS-3]|nr:hypothetical protein PLICRDRAFT_404877 [Plicaturopsis crispa FD-325 SS-3]
MVDAELEVAGGVFLSATYRMTGFTRTMISTLNLESGNDGDESAKCRSGFRRCIKSVVSVSVRIFKAPGGASLSKSMHSLEYICDGPFVLMSPQRVGDWCLRRYRCLWWRARRLP